MKHLEQRGELIIQTYASAVSSFVTEKSAYGQGREGRMQRSECPSEDGLVGDILILKLPFQGLSLVVQWLGYCASTAGGLTLIPGWELRSHKLCSGVKKIKQKFLSCGSIG